MKTPVKKINVEKEKIAVIHVCSEVERIKRVEQILVGNGHPEEGYVYKVLEMGKEIKEIKNHLTGISAVVKELHEDSIGQKSNTTLKKAGWQNILAVTGLLVAVFMAWLGFRDISEKIDATHSEAKITNDVLMGERSRGGLYVPPAFRNDTIK